MRVIRGRAADGDSRRGEGTFVGEVWLDPVLTGEDGVMVSAVAFAPGAHTHWHSHERGQLLQVTSGQGWVCAADGQPQEIRAGDVVWTPAGERHWHGATEHTHVVHTATSLGTTSWFEAPAVGD